METGSLKFPRYILCDGLCIVNIDWNVFLVQVVWLSQE